MLFKCAILFMLFIRESLFIVFNKENCLRFSDLHVQSIKCKQINFLLFYTYFLFRIILFLFK
jgi:hypothetical protein